MVIGQVWWAKLWISGLDDSDTESEAGDDTHMPDMSKESGEEPAWYPHGSKTVRGSA